MTRLLAWARRMLARIMRRQEEEPAPPQPISLPNRPARKKRSKDEEDYGAHYYLDNILDELDDYFTALRVVKRWAPDLYALYSRVGAQILPRSRIIDGGRKKTWNELPPIWRNRADRPAMGMVHFTGSKDNDKDIVWLRFAAFQKLHTASRIQRPGPDSDIYELILFWLNKDGGLSNADLHVEVTDDLQFRLLKECTLSVSAVSPNIKRYSKNPPSGNPRIRWDYPAAAYALAKHFTKEEGREFTPELAALAIMLDIASTAEYAVDGVQVRAKKGSIAAIFNINMLRTPYFFKDREKTVNERGNTKRIFHITRAHRRVTAGGAVRYIKSHFRGERRFKWNGYAVTITMPGLHHTILQRWNIGSYDAAEMKPKERRAMIDSKGVGERIAASMER